MKKVLVEIISANKIEKIFQDNFECDNLIDASRIMLTYQGKKGYEVININIYFVEGLV